MSYIIKYFSVLFILFTLKSAGQEKINLDSALASINTLADFYPDSALLLAQKLMEQDDLSEFQRDQTNNIIGNSYLSLGNYDSAKHYLKKGLSSNDRSVRAQSLNGLGAVDNYEKRYDQALENYLKAADLLVEVGDKKELAMIFNNVGLILVKTDQQDKAKTYLFQSLKLHQENNQPGNTIAVLANISNLYRTTNQLDSAAHFVQMALEQARNLNIRYAEGKCLLMLAAVQNETENYKGALQSAREGSSILMGFGDSASYNQGSILEAHALAGLGALSKSSLIAATLLADSLNAGSNLTSDLLSLLYSNAKTLGNKDTALFYLEKLREAEKKIFSSESNDKINELEIAYETAQKEASIENLKFQNDIQQLQLSRKNLWLIIGLVSIGALLAVTLVVYFFYQQRLTRKQKEAEDLRQKMLRIQLNPHFTYNSLNAIQSLIYQEGSRQKAADYLSSFSSLMRNILELNQHDYITLEEELDFMENYLEIQRVRFDGVIQYFFKIDDTLELNETLIPPMITQPFLENALEHGFPDKSQNGELYIAVSKKGAYLEIVIEDNGIGRDAAALLQGDKKHDSMATRITKERLSLLKKSLYQNATMEIKDLKSGHLIRGTSVTFKLPLIYG